MLLLFLFVLSVFFSSRFHHLRFAAWINDCPGTLDYVCGQNTVFRNRCIALAADVPDENIEDGLSQLPALKTLPNICIIDLDFYNKNVLAQLQELRTQYPTINLIAHNDIDAEKAVKPLLEIGFTGYLLIGSDTDDFKKAIDVVTNGGRYFSVGVAEIAQEYFSNK